MPAVLAVDKTEFLNFLAVKCVCEKKRAINPYNKMTKTPMAAAGVGVNNPIPNPIIMAPNISNTGKRRQRAFFLSAPLNIIALGARSGFKWTRNQMTKIKNKTASSPGKTAA